MNVLLDAGKGLDVDVVGCGKSVDQLLHQKLRCRGAGRDADRAGALEPGEIQVLGAVDQVGRPAGGRPISRRRLEFELFRAPTTRITSTSRASARTAVCRFWVA